MLGLLLRAFLGKLGLRLHAGLLLTLTGHLTAAAQLVACQLAMFFAQFTGRCTVQVKTLGGFAQCHQVAGTAGVAAEKRRQRGLAENPRSTLVDVGLDAQLHRLGLVAKQRREMLLQQRGAGRRGHVTGGGRGSGACISRRGCGGGCGGAYRRGCGGGCGGGVRSYRLRRWACAGHRHSGACRVKRCRVGWVRQRRRQCLWRAAVRHVNGQWACLGWPIGADGLRCGHGGLGRRVVHGGRRWCGWTGAMAYCRCCCSGPLR